MEDLNKLFKDKIDLGPMWNEIELEVFLKTFKSSGIQQLQKMQDTLRQLGYFRTLGQLLSVYRKNKNVLESNPLCTAHDLYLILSDHYEQNEPHKFNLKTTKKQQRSSKTHIVTASKFHIGVEDPIKLISTGLCQGNHIASEDITLDSNFCDWIKHEHFYSHLDYTYFSLNEFQEMLKKAEIELTPNSIGYWKRVRRAMGRPRLYSPCFIAQEKQKLYKFRSIVRNYLFDQNYPIHRDIKNLDLIRDIVKLAPFSVGQVVLAIHPACGHVHQGTILSTNLPTIVMRFQQSDLGVHKVSDQNIQLEDKFLSTQVTENRFDIQQQLSQNTQNESKNAQISQLVQDVDHWAAAFLIRILQRRYALVQHLKNLNQQIRDNPELGKNNEFRDFYAWTCVMIRTFELAQKHVITKFRIRGLNSYQFNQVNNNIDKVLSMPLAYMERELDQNGLQDDKQKQELKQIISKFQDVNPIGDKIHAQVLQMLNSKFEYDEKDTKFYTLIQSLLGIVFTLNNTGDINLNTNVYMKQLAKQIYASHPQQYMEINELIIKIVGNGNK